MKKLSLLVFIWLLFIQPTLGQNELQLMKLNNEHIAELPKSDVLSYDAPENESTFLNNRFNVMGYKPMKLENYQVISSYQPNSNFDIVYYIDNSGSTVRRTFAPTAPMNFNNIYNSNYDSMNPYGSVDMKSVLINGILGALFNKGQGNR